MFKWPAREDVFFSIKSFIGSMLALYLAFHLGLPRPFWAMLTAYVVSQPIAGAVRSKALYRVIGTFIGAVMTVLLVPRFINYAILLSLAFSIWSGICLYVSMLDRTPRSYVFMLAGYSVTLIALPSLIDISIFNVSTIYDAALARVEEITLGIICSTLIHSLLFPRSVGKIVLGRMDEALNNARQWVQNVLTQTQIDPDNPIDLNKLALIITELRLMSTHLPFDTSSLRWTSNIMRVLQDRLSALIPILLTVDDRLRAFRHFNSGQLPPEWQKLLIDIANWVGCGMQNDPANAIKLRRRIDQISPVIDTHSHWEDMLLANLTSELYQLVDACENCFDLRRKINIGLSGAIPANGLKITKISTNTLLIDHRQALMSAFATTMALGLSCLFWVASGWSMGFCAPMMAGMCCMFFATMDNPLPALKIQFVYTLLSTPAAGLYLLLFLPSAHTFEMLMLVFAPFLLITGIYLAKPATAIKTVPFMFSTIATLTMYDMGSANMTAFINSQISQIIGVGMAFLCTSLFRSVNIQAITRRLVQALWEDISRLGNTTRIPSVMAVTVRMVDGVSLLAPRLAIAKKTASSENEDLSAMNILSDLCIGVNMTRLLRIQSKLQRQNVYVHPLLQNLSQYFRQRINHSIQNKLALLQQIDQTLYQTSHIHPNVQQNSAIAALAGIRRDLFPDALPYTPLANAKKENHYEQAA